MQDAQGEMSARRGQEVEVALTVRARHLSFRDVHAYIKIESRVDMSIADQRDVSAAAGLDPDGSVRDAIDHGRTLPSSWYTDEETFKREERQIFRRAWEFVGHAGDVSRAGDFFTCMVGGVPVVVVRGRDDIVRAFLNICRHRHNQVAVGRGNTPVLQCRYHAWSYKLDGTLAGAPRSKEDPTFDRSSLCLSSLAIARYGDMIFVNPSNDAPPLLEVLGPIPRIAREKGLPLETATFRECRSFDVEANWKIPWDNNVECYHCPTVHSSWYKDAKLDPEHVYSFPIGPFHFQHVVEQREDARIDNHFYCWPTICITTDSSTGANWSERAFRPGSVAGASHADSSGHQFFFMWKFVGVSARSTRLELHLFCVGSMDGEAVDELFASLFSVLSEDKVICESVQRSHDSGLGELGTLIPAIDSEFNTLVWERLVHRAVVEPSVPLYAPIMEFVEPPPKAAERPPHTVRDWRLVTA